MVFDSLLFNELHKLTSEKHKGGKKEYEQQHVAAGTAGTV